MRIARVVYTAPPNRPSKFIYIYIVFDCQAVYSYVHIPSVYHFFHIRHRQIIGYRYGSDNLIMTRWRSVLLAQNLNLFLLWSYYVLPGACSVIFRTFRCTGVKESNSSSAAFFMTEDSSISCSSDRYRVGCVWASLMILVYPIGIPVLYGSLLYEVRQSISSY